MHSHFHHPLSTHILYAHTIISISFEHAHILRRGLMYIVNLQLFGNPIISFRFVYLSRNLRGSIDSRIFLICICFLIDVSVASEHNQDLWVDLQRINLEIECKCVEL